MRGRDFGDQWSRPLAAGGKTGPNMKDSLSSKVTQLVACRTRKQAWASASQARALPGVNSVKKENAENVP